MTVFTTQVTSKLTPKLKQFGFKKTGVFDRCELSDHAAYVRRNSRLLVTLQLHPYDYPDVGIKVRYDIEKKVVFESLYPMGNGGILEIIDMICRDVDDGIIPLDLGPE